MLSPTKLKTFLTTNPRTKYIDHFFKTHIYLEGYIKRVMLIGLRLRKVQYENSVKIIGSTYLKTPQLIERVIWLLDTSGNSQRKTTASLKKNFPDFFLLMEVVLKFSSPYRNQLAHGTIDDIRDQETIDWLCHSNVSFFNSFEGILQSKYGESAFDKPGDWGAVRGNSEAIAKSASRLNFKILAPPMSLNEVKNKLAKTKYAKL